MKLSLNSFNITISKEPPDHADRRRLPLPIKTCDIFGSSDPFPRWSWYTYARRARRSMNVARKRACARWKVSALTVGALTSPRDPVFDLCRACERVYLGDR